MTQLKYDDGMRGAEDPLTLKELESLLDELRGVLVHIRNSAAPHGYIYTVAEEAIAKCNSWK